MSNYKKGSFYFEMLSSLLFLAFFNVLFSFYVYSEPVSTLTISGEVRSNPKCIINDGLPMEVSFGNAVVIPFINGVKYKHNLPFEIVCQNNPTNNVKIRLSGIGSVFDSNLLSTSESGLGIRLLKGSDEVPVNINDWLQIDSLNPPKFKVVLVKDEGSILNAGPFNAVATLTAEIL